MAPPWRTWPPARKSYGGIFDFDAKFERLRTVNASLEDPSVWNDPKKAQELGKEQKSLSSVVVTLDKLTRELADNAELYEMSKEEGDEAGLLTIEAEADKLRPLIEELENPWAVALLPDGSALLSARETSTIIKIDDLEGTPTLDYMIGEPSVWNGMDAQPSFLTKVGDSGDTGGQHSITVQYDSSLEDGQYYIYMFDNDFA